MLKAARSLIGGCLAAGALLALSTPRTEAADPSRPPNFIIIFCDDLGYGDLGCFGSTVHRTPNIDRLAAEGMKFTSFYVSAPVCTPSRSSLMTGCYPRRVGMHESARGEWVLFPLDRKGLHPDEITLAELLRERGYATACIGKWHLGDQTEFLPTRQGFDSFFGIPYSNDMGAQQKRPLTNPPLPLMRNETVIEAPADQSTLTRRYTQEAIAFLEDNRDKPFFLYLPHTFPHVPLFASPDFAGKSMNGKYGDAVEELDWSTGEILRKLKELELDEHTLIVFTSDNGAARSPGGSNAPLRGYKGTTWEGGMRIPCVMRWTGKIPAGRACDELAVSFDLPPTFARLAGTSAPSDRVIDGRDIWPLMAGAPGATTPHKVFYYYRVRKLEAVRSGRWKLHLVSRQTDAAEQTGGDAPLLFDLQTDIGETTNVADKHPEVVQQLLTLAEEARRDLGDEGRQGENQRPAALVETAAPQQKPTE